MDSKAKQAINYITKQIVKNGLVQLERDDEAYYVIRFTRFSDSFQAEVEEVNDTHPADIVAGTDEDGNQVLEVPLPQYQDEIGIEDEHDALLLDLTFIVSEWLKKIPSSKGGKKASSNMTAEERSDRARKAAQKRWHKD